MRQLCEGDGNGCVIELDGGPARLVESAPEGKP